MNNYPSQVKSQAAMYTAASGQYTEKYYWQFSNNFCEK